jgi:CheY-like chemotaxis protein
VPRILILDDEPLIAMMVEEWLTELGCETVGPANSVSSALGLLQSDSVDAAILDLSLGNEKSYAVADALRELRIPFAFATGYGESGMANRFNDTPVLSKPFDFRELKRTLGELLNRAPHEMSAAQNQEISGVAAVSPPAGSDRSAASRR